MTPECTYVNILQDFVDLSVLVMEVKESEKLEDDFLRQYFEKAIEVAVEFFRENGLEIHDGDEMYRQLNTFSRDARLGCSSQPLYNDLCEWLISKHPKFADSIIWTATT